MKKLFLLMGMILLGAAVSAQQPSTGITGKGFKVGFDFSDINTDYDELDNFLDGRTGVLAGAYLTYSFDRQFALQPEIFYVQKGAGKDLFIFSAEWSINYLEIPVLLKFNLSPEAKVQPSLFAGPALGVLLSSKVSAVNESIDVKDGMKSTDISLVFGGGVDYKKVTFDVRYTLGLTNVIDAGKINSLTGAEPGDYFYLGGDPSVKNTNISFMVGVRF